MSVSDYIDISSDEEIEVREVKDVKPIISIGAIQDKACYTVANNYPDNEEFRIKQRFQEQRWPNIVNGLPYGSHIVDQSSKSTDAFCSAYTSYGSSTPLCRQFWKSGDYDVGQPLARVSRNSKNRLRIHPRFLHSNATSHKWAFGAIAELLDNAVDEMQNGATFVIVDKFNNPRNGDATLLIQDDGGGMDPEMLRRCMSFGFSDKQSDASIGQYGNGFKTSTMRLGADVIVFSRCTNKRTITESVGLLSYTFLRQTGCDDIVVPVVDYEFDPSTGAFMQLIRADQKQFTSNLSTLLRWSPFSSEIELLNQFNDIGHHGTKVIVFNLWYNDDGKMELDFESDAKDIMINKTKTDIQKRSIEYELTQKNVASRLQYSLRAYCSVLYLHIPESFKIMLRGQIVMPHHIVNDLIYCECIKYRPQVEGYPEVLTTVGFLEGAPNVNVHGFNVYHKNRLILPFWRVANNSWGKGRGVVGVLEANFIKPTHDKQDFEKSTIFQKLESRLKEMTYEYWDLHCHLVGYRSKLKTKPTAAPASQMPPLRTSDGSRNANERGASFAATSQPVTALSIPMVSTPGQLIYDSGKDQTGRSHKRKQENQVFGMDSLKKKAVAAELGDDNKAQLELYGGSNRRQENESIMLENKKLREQCFELEESEKKLLLKEEKLRRELQEVLQGHKKLLLELKSLDDQVKVEKP